MSIKEKLKADLVTAMKAKEQAKVDCIRFVNAAIKKVSANKDFQAALELEGLVASVGTPDALEAYVRQEEARWTKIVQEAGITDQP